jgi:hypothetical protein
VLLELPDSSWPQLAAEFSPAFDFDISEALFVSLKYPSLFS